MRKESSEQGRILKKREGKTWGFRGLPPNVLKEVGDEDHDRVLDRQVCLDDV